MSLLGTPRDMRSRERIKQLLARLQRPTPAQGVTLLIYHRVGGGTRDELDVAADTFDRQARLLARHEVVSLDTALDRLDAGDLRPCVVITFDDGFEDVHRHAWPVLRELGLPFTVYLSTAYVGSPMVWEGSTAQGERGQGMSWAQLREMVESGLCTVGNHTHRHARPELLSATELDECNAEVARHLGVTPTHFTYPWGIVVEDCEPLLRERFRSASTGLVGRNGPDTDRWRLRRVPVRKTDPDAFFAAKLVGSLGPERAYAAVITVAKALRVHKLGRA